MCNNEIWLPVKNFEGLYEVSNFGNVRSLSRIVEYPNKGKRLFYGKLLSIRQNKKRANYCEVKLKNQKIVKNYKIHRLVAEAFLNNEKNFSCVNHKDFDTTNNKLENLEWCNHKYNNDYSKINRKDMKGKYGRKIIAYDLNNNYIGTYGSVREAGRQLECFGQNICLNLSGKIKKCKNYIFKDVEI